MKFSIWKSALQIRDQSLLPFYLKIVSSISRSLIFVYYCYSELLLICIIYNFFCEVAPTDPFSIFRIKCFSFYEKIQSIKRYHKEIHYLRKLVVHNLESCIYADSIRNQIISAIQYFLESRIIFSCQQYFRIRSEDQRLLGRISHFRIEILVGKLG